MTRGPLQLGMFEKLLVSLLEGSKMSGGCQEEVRRRSEEVRRRSGGGGREEVKKRSGGGQEEVRDAPDFSEGHFTSHLPWF